MATCHACNAELRAAVSIGTAGYVYARCAGCGSASLTGGHAEASYEKEYLLGGRAGGYYDYEADAKLHLETARRRVEMALSARPDGPQRLVDIGAAVGYTLDIAREIGWESIGVEVSEHSAARARQRGHTIVTDISQIETSSVGVAIFGQVLEHMPDPYLELRSAHTILVPGGVLFIETWDLGSRTARMFGRFWQQLSPPSVIHLFTRPGIELLLKREGFEDVRIQKWRKRVSLGGYLGVIAGKLPNWAGGTLMKAATVSRLTRIPITYRFDDLIAVTARKPASS